MFKNDHRYLVIIALYKKAKFCEIKVKYLFIDDDDYWSKNYLKEQIIDYFKEKITYSVLLMTWKPNPVSTTSETAPTSRAKAASEKGFAMTSNLNLPKSPPLVLEGPSECLAAKMAKS